MKNSKNLLILVSILFAVIVAAAIIWSNSSDKTFKFGSSKNSCDYRFLQWCKDNPRAGDYDNFGNTARECIGQGLYRTCDQVMKALPA